MPRGKAATKRIIKNTGYVYLWEPTHPLANSDGYVAEHRKVVYEAGIEVPPGAHVHHKNHDPLDNRLENLEVLTQSEHRRHHVAGIAGTGINARRLAYKASLGDRRCEVCGTDINDKRTDARSCSAPCRQKLQRKLGLR